MSKKSKEQKRKRRHVHLRKKLYGTAQKPRMFVFKSNKFFYVGLADDEKGKVLGSVFAPKKGEVGKNIAKNVLELLKKLKIDTVVFDRSGYKFHGNIKLLVEELRNKGINI